MNPWNRAMTRRWVGRSTHEGNNKEFHEGRTYHPLPAAMTCHGSCKLLAGLVDGGGRAQRSRFCKIVKL